MHNSSNDGCDLRRCDCSALLVTLAIGVVFTGQASGQTASTGALTGVTLDPSGALQPGVVVSVFNQNTGETQSVTSDGEGRFGFPSLAPGGYELHATKTGFAALSHAGINISVTETVRLELDLRLATISHSVQVTSEPPMVQTDNSALGRAVYGSAISGLPMATRNFAQIAV